MAEFGRELADEGNDSPKKEIRTPLFGRDLGGIEIHRTGKDLEIRIHDYGKELPDGGEIRTRDLRKDLGGIEIHRTGKDLEVRIHDFGEDLPGGDEIPTPDLGKQVRIYDYDKDLRQIEIQTTGVFGNEKPDYDEIRARDVGDQVRIYDYSKDLRDDEIQSPVVFGDGKQVRIHDYGKDRPDNNEIHRIAVWESAGKDSSLVVLNEYVRVLQEPISAVEARDRIRVLMTEYEDLKRQASGSKHDIKTPDQVSPKSKLRK